MYTEVLLPKFEKGSNGLIPAVAQDADTFEVLMVAWVNEEAWRKTLSTGQATFWSRSRGKLWTKGEESGNFLNVVAACIDCDGDTLIYLVEPQGDKLACHTKARSCFYRSAVNLDLEEPAPKAGKDEQLAIALIEVADKLVASDRSFFQASAE